MLSWLIYIVWFELMCDQLLCYIFVHTTGFYVCMVFNSNLDVLTSNNCLLQADLLLKVRVKIYYELFVKFVAVYVFIIV